MPPLVGNSLGSVGERSLTPSESDDDDEARRSTSIRASSVTAKARRLGIEVVDCTHPQNLARISQPIVDVIFYDDVSIAMRKIVKKIVLEKQPLFRGMIQSVRPAKCDDFRWILTDVVGYLIAGSSSSDDSPQSRTCTWWKIVTAYAFGGFFANEVLASSTTSTLGMEELGNIVGDVIDQAAGAWIEQQGGWPSSAKSFSTVIAEESTTRNLVYVFGTLASAAFGLACWKTMKQ